MVGLRAGLGAGTALLNTLRVASVVDAFPRASETFVVDQLRALQRAGCDVTIFAKACGEEPFDPALADLVARTVIREVPATTTAKATNVAAAALRLLATRPRHAPGALTRMVRRGALVPIAWLDQARRLGPFDVVHAQFGPNAAWAVQLQDAGLATLSAVSFYGYDLRHTPEEIELLYRGVLDRIDVCFAQSEWAAGVVEAMGAPADRIRIQPLGIDLDTFRPGRGAVARSGGPTVTIATVARMVPEKRLDLALRAIALVHERRPGAIRRYHLVGDGPLRSQLEALVEELGIGGLVEMPGAAHHAEVMQVLDGADLFLLSSENEGLPVSLLEAQAMELPVVATDVGAVVRGLSVDRSGLLVPPGSVERLAEAIERLALDAALRRRFGSAGRAFVAERYDAESLNRQLIETYRALLAAPRGGRRARPGT